MTTFHTPEVSDAEETVTVKLWEVYLRYNNAQLYRDLSDLCLENATTPEEDIAGRVTFLFSRNVWERKVKHLLHENRIPATVRSPRMTALRMREHSLN